MLWLNRARRHVRDSLANLAGLTSLTGLTSLVWFKSCGPITSLAGLTSSAGRTSCGPNKSCWLEQVKDSFFKNVGLERFGLVWLRSCGSNQFCGLNKSCWLGQVKVSFLGSPLGPEILVGLTNPAGRASFVGLIRLVGLTTSRASQAKLTS